MSTALIQSSELLAPSVGLWRPEVGLGTPLSPGLRLGHLVQVGRLRPVYVPDTLEGVVITSLVSGQWVAYGDKLASFAQAGSLGESSTGAASIASGLDGPTDALPIRAETDGTIYLRPEPTAAPFVAPAQRIEAQTTLALVEVMKTFTAVRAPFAGEWVRFDVAEGASVEAGQVLGWIRRPS